VSYPAARLRRVLANLCVAYIMTSQNEEAEEIMKRVEAEEALVTSEAGSGSGADGAGGMGSGSAASAGTGSKPVFHLCIINLVRACAHAP